MLSNEGERLNKIGVQASINYFFFPTPLGAAASGGISPRAIASSLAFLAAIFSANALASFSYFNNST